MRHARDLQVTKAPCDVFDGSPPRCFRDKVLSGLRRVSAYAYVAISEDVYRVRIGGVPMTQMHKSMHVSTSTQALSCLSGCVVSGFRCPATTGIDGLPVYKHLSGKHGQPVYGTIPAELVRRQED